MKRLDQGYELIKDVNDNGEEDHSIRYIAKSLLNGYVSIGAGVLLHRLLVSLGVPEIFNVVVFNQHWELTLASYVWKKIRK